MQSHENINAITAYFASLLGWLQDVEWTTLGAAILLIARLMIDVPRAIEVTIHYWKKRNDKTNGN